MAQHSPCPVCGYLLAPFEKDCPRCASFKALGKAAPPVATAAPPVPVPPPPAPPPLVVLPPIQPIPQAAPPQVVYTHVTLQQGNNGWLAAWFLLLFTTPLGCLVIPALLIAGLAVLTLGMMAWPLVTASVVAVIVARLPPGILSPRYTPWAVVAILLIGTLFTALVWPETKSAPAVAPSHAPGAVTR